MNTICVLFEFRLLSFRCLVTAYNLSVFGGKGQKQKQIFKECNDITSVNKCQILILMVLLF